MMQQMEGKGYKFLVDSFFLLFINDFFFLQVFTLCCIVATSLWLYIWPWSLLHFAVDEVSLLASVCFATIIMIIMQDIDIYRSGNNFLSTPSFLLYWWLHVKLFVHSRRPFLSRMYRSYSVPGSRRQYWVGKACECRGFCNSVKLYEAFAACHAQRSAKVHLNIRRGQVHRVFVGGHAFCLCVCVRLRARLPKEHLFFQNVFLLKRMSAWDTVACAVIGGCLVVAGPKISVMHARQLRNVEDRETYI